MIATQQQNRLVRFLMSYGHVMDIVVEPAKADDAQDQWSRVRGGMDPGHILAGVDAFQRRYMVDLREAVGCFAMPFTAGQGQQGAGGAVLPGMQRGYGS